MEQILVILKPDAVNRGLVGEITHRFERKGLKIVGAKMETLKTETLHEHYAHHKDKPFFEELVEFMQTVPAILLVLEGKECVEVIRSMVGETSGRKAPAGTIRGDFSNDSPALANAEKRAVMNLVHASETPEEAAHEIEYWFGDKEIFEYKRFGVDA